MITKWGFIGDREAQSAGGRNSGNAINHRKMAVRFVGCSHVQVATLSQSGVKDTGQRNENLSVGPHHCGDAACKVPSRGHFERSLKNIEFAITSMGKIQHSWMSSKKVRLHIHAFVNMMLHNLRVRSSVGVPVCMRNVHSKVTHRPTIPPGTCGLRSMQQDQQEDPTGLQKPPQTLNLHREHRMFVPPNVSAS